MAEDIINKVAASGLITINLEEFYTEGKRIAFDIKPHLFQELILREKDFREFLNSEDWSKYKDAYVALFCSVDAIIPTWAYMLLATKLQPYAKRIVFGNLEFLEATLYNQVLKEKIIPTDYIDKRIVIKGCGNLPVPIQAYVELTNILKPVVKSIMYGEPCSTVPVYKK